MMWNRPGKGQVPVQVQVQVANGGAAGTKRRADHSNLSDSERFAKRFNLLNLGMQNQPTHHETAVLTECKMQAPMPVATTTSPSRTSRRQPTRRLVLHLQTMEPHAP